MDIIFYQISLAKKIIHEQKKIDFATLSNSISKWKLPLNQELNAPSTQSIIVIRQNNTILH